MGNCSDFHLSRSAESTYIQPSAPTAIRNNVSYVNFTIKNVTREYEDVTMTVQAENSEEDLSYKSFTLDIYGEYLSMYTCNMWSQYIFGYIPLVVLYLYMQQG